MKIVALAALASFLAPAVATLCPSTDACDGDCSGTYDGYATSTIIAAGGNNTNRADLHAVLTATAGQPVTMALTMTNPTCRSTASPSTCAPAESLPSCTATFDVKCLIDTQPDIWQFYLRSPVPSCWTNTSDWRCKFKMTSGVNPNPRIAAFTSRITWDSSSSYDFRFDPIGTFLSGCPTDSEADDRFDMALNPQKPPPQNAHME